VLQQDISAAADVAVRKYKEDTGCDAVTKAGIEAAMRTSIRDSTEKYYKKLSKIVAVANPALGRDWLLEVCSNREASYHHRYSNDILFTNSYHSW
jgi:hypothetical protein